MKRIIFIVSLLALTLTSFAQNFNAADYEVRTIKVEEAERTEYTYTIKGVVYPIYKSKKGAFYIVRTSKNGKQYRQYLPKELQIKLGRKYDN